MILSRGGAVGTLATISFSTQGGESPVRSAELPVAGGGGLHARRFPCARVGRGHIAERQEPDIESARSEASCKKSPLHIPRS
jgi:hypothetical protein